MAHDPASLIEPPARVTLAGNGWGVAAIVGGAVSGLAVGGECYAPHGDRPTDTEGWLRCVRSSLRHRDGGNYRCDM